MASERGVFGLFVGVVTAAVAGTAVADATAVDICAAGAGSVGGKAVAAGCAGANVGSSVAAPVATIADCGAMPGCAHATRIAQLAANIRQRASIMVSRLGQGWASTLPAGLHFQIQPKPVQLA